MVPPPFICRILLLGARNATSPPEPGQLHHVRRRLVEVLLRSNTRYVALTLGSLPFTHSFTAEERYLIKFFGDQYKEYRRRVGVKIPFIP